MITFKNFPAVGFEIARHVACIAVNKHMCFSACSHVISAGGDVRPAALCKAAARPQPPSEGLYNVGSFTVVAQHHSLLLPCLQPCRWCWW
jgi:hypothetical protein